MENGTITLLGATTENPSFSLNSALLSRCRVVVLDKLTSANVEQILKRAIVRLNADIFTGKDEVLLTDDTSKVWVDSKAMTGLADLSDGDARSALNGLELAIQTKKASLSAQPEKKGVFSSAMKQSDTAASVEKIVSLDDVLACFQKTHLLYDRTDQKYHCISALHKSMRGSDANASLYWLARMLCAGEDPLYIARRVIAFASEDIGITLSC